VSGHPTRRFDDRPGAPARRAGGGPAWWRHVRADAGREWGWFADEIAIDFPSVGAVVDRMRDAFLAPDEPLRALSAEIAVTALDAWTGTVVVFDLPVRGTCSACGGRGEKWTELCADCRGSGEAISRHPVQLVVPPRVVDGAWIRLQVSIPHAPTTRVDVRVTIA